MTGFRLQADRDRGSVEGIRIFYDTGRLWPRTGSIDIYQGFWYCTPAYAGDTCGY